MATIVNSTPLELILTSYGLERVAEAIARKSVTLNLGKIKVGNANGEFYIPSENMENLVNEKGEFFVVDKALLEDGLTVSFHAIIPESFGNIDIREVGLCKIGMVEHSDKHCGNAVKACDSLIVYTCKRRLG